MPLLPIAVRKFATERCLRCHWDCYVTSGLLSSHTNFNGNTSYYDYYKYDADHIDGQLKRAENAAGEYKEFSRTHASGDYAVQMTTAEGVVQEYGFSEGSTPELERQMSFADGSQATKTYANDADGNRTYTTELPDGTTVDVTWSEDPRADFAKFARYPSSTVETTPDGGQIRRVDKSISASQDSNAQITAWTETTSTYRDDDFDETTPLEQFDWLRTYDPAPASGPTGTAYSWEETTPEGRTTTYFYDAQGRLLQSEHPGVGSREYTYAGGRIDSIVHRSVSGSFTRTTDLVYDASGNLDTLTDAEQNVTDFLSYDGLGRLLSVDEPNVDSMTRNIDYSWDGAGEMASLTTPNDDSHALDYTPAGRLETYTPPTVSGGDESTGYSYDLDGRLDQMTLPGGAVVDRTYDSSGRLSTETASGVDKTYTYFDYALDGTNRLHTIESTNTSDGSVRSSIEYSYDGSLTSTIREM